LILARFILGLMTTIVERLIWIRFSVVYW